VHSRFYLWWPGFDWLEHPCTQIVYWQICLKLSLCYMLEASTPQLGISLNYFCNELIINNCYRLRPSLLKVVDTLFGNNPIGMSTEQNRTELNWTEHGVCLCVCCLLQESLVYGITYLFTELQLYWNISTFKI